MNTPIIFSILNKEPICLSVKSDSNTKVNVFSGNRLRMLVMVSSFDTENAGKNLIVNILNACKISDNEYCICLIQEKATFLNLLQIAENVLLFGVNPQELGLPINLWLHQNITIGEKNFILTTHPEQLSQNAALKGELWNKCLKPLFI